MKKIIAIMLLAVGIFGCDDIIELQDISSDMVILVAPSNDTTLRTTTLNFSWEPIADADNYQIQIATPDFENPLQIVVDSIVTTNYLSVSLENNSYEWRVRAKNSGYQTNYSKQNFTIEE